jgi:hypothetical protein
MPRPPHPLDDAATRKITRSKTQNPVKQNRFKANLFSQKVHP